MENIFKTNGITLPALNTIDDMTEIKAVAKLTNPMGWEWFVVAGDEQANGDVYCYGKVYGDFTEWGMFLLSEVLLMLGILDLEFIPQVIE